MSKKNSILEIKDMLNIDAFEIHSTREKVKLIHSTKDIKCAGDELEIVLREKIQERLPSKYHVGQGHIIDNNLNLSTQTDILITDTNTPFIMKSKNMTEYLPYESIYAYGEIKTSYKKEHVFEFIERIKDTNSRLTRKEMANNYFSLGGKFGITNIQKTNAPYNNPIFKFLIICDSGQLNENDIYTDLSDKFSKEEYGNLPDCILLLDKGLIFNCTIEIENHENHIGKINILTEYLKKGENYKWTFSPFGDGKPESGAHWGIFISMLYEAVITIQLEPPNILEYFRKINKTVPSGKVLSPMNNIT